MARPAEKDPLDKFRWTVKIEGFTRLGFSACGVPSISYNTNTYAEGGAHLFPKKIVDSVEYRPITLTRGVTTDQSFGKWARNPIEIVRGRTENPTIELESVDNTALANAIGTPDVVATNKEVLNIPLDYRRDVVIEHRNRAGKIVKKYILYNAFPIEYVPASDFASDGDDVLSLETLTLAYEGFEVRSSNVDTNPNDVTDVAKRAIRNF